MIVVRVELHSAITGKVTEIARAHIANIGGTKARGDYSAKTYRGRTAEQLSRMELSRHAVVVDYPRLSIHVWHLVARALVMMGYAGKAEQRQASDMIGEAERAI